MIKYNVLKSTLFFLAISLAIVFHYTVPSNVMAYGGPYDAFGINEDGTMIALGGPGYPNLYYNGNQWWPYSPPRYEGPNSYYPYGGFGNGYPTYGYNGYQQSFNPYGYQQPFNPYGYQQSFTPYGYQQSYNAYG